jgi:hypothetical protein
MFYGFVLIIEGSGRSGSRGAQKHGDTVTRAQRMNNRSRKKVLFRRRNEKRKIKEKKNKRENTGRR